MVGKGGTVFCECEDVACAVTILQQDGYVGLECGHTITSRRYRLGDVLHCNECEWQAYKEDRKGEKHV